MSESIRIQKMWILRPYGMNLSWCGSLYVMTYTLNSLCSYCVLQFGCISTFMTMIEGILVWYTVEMIFKNQYEFDEIGTGQCLKFFTVTLTAGMTFLVSSVGKSHHEWILKYVGLPLDFSEKYLVYIR